MPFCTHLVVAFQNCGECFPAETWQCFTTRPCSAAVDGPLQHATAAGLGVVLIKLQMLCRTQESEQMCNNRQLFEVQLTFVFLPFWCPINMKVCPSILARPQTIAGSSRPARSPCSSTNLSEMLRATSRNVGLFGCRATCKRCTGVRREYVSFRNCTKVYSVICKIAAPNVPDKFYSQ